jgi:hypothetical protein
MDTTLEASEMDTTLEASEVLGYLVILVKRLYEDLKAKRAEEAA